jgi:hypothetical protein
MTDINSELKARLVVGRKQDGRCRYDPQAKRELIEACLVPGVSVARLALEHGLNANLLRSWVSAYKRKCDGAAIVPASRTAKPTPAAFIPALFGRLGALVVQTQLGFFNAPRLTKCIPLIDQVGDSAAFLSL